MGCRTCDHALIGCLAEAVQQLFKGFAIARGGHGVGCKNPAVDAQDGTERQTEKYRQLIEPRVVTATKVLQQTRKARGKIGRHLPSPNFARNRPLL